MPADARPQTLAPRLWLTVTIALVTALAGAAVGAIAARPLAVALPSLPSANATTTALRPTPNVLLAVRDLARVEGASFHVEKVIDLTDKQSHFFGLVRADDAILLVAAADVVAGVDLAKMTANDVIVDHEGKRARLTLPPPAVFSTTLDNAHTYVHTRRTGLLADRDETLESRARAEAESSLHDAAVEAGVLDRARTGAERAVSALVRSLGFDEVEVRTREAAVAAPGEGG